MTAATLPTSPPRCRAGLPFAALALAAACAATPAAAQRAPGRWTVGVLDRTQGSISVVSRDRQFGLEASCRRGTDGKVRFSLFLFMPKQWAPQTDWTNAVIDGAPVSLQNDGSEDGIGLSDAISDNQIGVSAELRARLIGARSIEIPGTSRRRGLADVASFEPTDPQGVLPRWTAHCAGLGPDAATTPLPPFSAPPAAAGPQGQAPVQNPAAAQAQVPPPAAPPQPVAPPGLGTLAGSGPRGALAPPPPPSPPPATPAAAPSGRYLFDILALPAQGAAWRAMTGTRAPAWVRTMQGPSAPSRAVTVEGRPYELAWLCRARSCDENQFVALFTADGATAYGVLRERNRVTFYGDPTEPLRQALVDGFDASR